MKTISIFFIITAFYPMVNAQNRAMGLVDKGIDTALVIKKSFPVTRGDLPSSHSLAFLVPPVLSQGNLGSCTSWSTAYYGMSILKRIENKNVSGPVYSPVNLHSRIKVRGYEVCNVGSWIGDAMNVAKVYGCKRMGSSENLFDCHSVSGQESYTDKLYDYRALTVSVYDIKRALLENSPVVFGIKAFNYTGWENSSNHIEGVWNGYYTSGPSSDGGHAMTIVGFDDDVPGGGAFNVVNSWGTDWGSQGFFWIRYSDIRWSHCAYQMMLNPYKNTSIEAFYNSDDDYNFDNENNNNNNNYSSGQVIRFTNQCHENLYVSLAQYNSNRWNAIGWYAVASGASVDLSINERDADAVYWIGQVTDKNGSTWWWTGNDENSKFCLDEVNAFDITDNAYPSCPSVRSFRRESPGYNTPIYSKLLTCENIPTRGGDIQLKTSDLKVDIDPRPYDVANKNWNKKFALFDVYTGKIIQPTQRNGEDFYHVFVIKGKKILELHCTARELEEFKCYKFGTKESAEAYQLIK